MAIERFFEACRFGFAGRGSSHHNNINTAEHGASVPETFTNTALDPVAIHGALGYAPGYSHPQARMSQRVGSCLNAEEVILVASGVALHRLKITGRAQPEQFGQAKPAAALLQALRRARPLARRALRTLRPPLVAMRARNPCTRLRLSLLG